MRFSLEQHPVFHEYGSFDPEGDPADALNGSDRSSDEAEVGFYGAAYFDDGPSLIDAIDRFDQPLGVNLGPIALREVPFNL